MKPARMLYESWLFGSIQGPLSGWKQALLARALRRDLGLRCLAVELLEFECDPETPDLALDLRASLREHILAEEQEPERPLFPSAWIPAGAIVALILTAVVALTVHPFKPSQTEASVQPALANAPLPYTKSVPVAQAQVSTKALQAMPAPLSASGKTVPTEPVDDALSAPGPSAVSTGSQP
ncbi:MAG: hypothetical protein ACREKE_05180 [bacterium]